MACRSIGTRDKAKADTQHNYKGEHMSKEEWQGVEDTPRAQWYAMCQRHEQELAELQTANAKAVIVLVTNHMLERDELRKGNK